MQDRRASALGAGLCHREAPVHRGSSVVTFNLPTGNFVLEGGPIQHAAVQTLAAEYSEPQFRYVELTLARWGVMHLQLLHQTTHVRRQEGLTPSRWLVSAQLR
jgi:hypothetical protein